MQSPLEPLATPDRGTVLVVDDAPETLRLLCDTLEASGYTVLVARDGETAIKRLGYVLPDAILCDLRLGSGLDGVGVTAAVSQRPDAPPVVILTTAVLLFGFALPTLGMVIAIIVLTMLSGFAAHDKNYKDAKRLAEQAEWDARVAERKAQAAKAEKAVQDAQKAVQELRQEGMRSVK